MRERKKTIRMKDRKNDREIDIMLACRLQNWSKKNKKGINRQRKRERKR